MERMRGSVVRWFQSAKVRCAALSLLLMERIRRSVVRWFQSAKVRCVALSSSTKVQYTALSLLLFAGIIVVTEFCRDWLQENGEMLRNVSFLVAAGVGLPLAIWRTKTADRQADTAQQSLLNERYQKGAEMLGNSALAVRMGGIYALQRLAEDHPEQFYIQMMELLCAFVRQPTKDRNLKRRQMDDEKKDDETLLSVREDVQAVMAAIGSLRKTGKELEKDDFKLDLQGASLRSGDFSGMNLSGARLGKC